MYSMAVRVQLTGMLPHGVESVAHKMQIDVESNDELDNSVLSNFIYNNDSGVL